MLLARTYSHHSLLSAVPKIKDLIKNAKAKGYTSVALTDEETGSGLIEFYDTCKALEVKPVLGVTLKMPNISGGEISFGSNKHFSKVGILAKDESGYKALLELISIARTVQETPTYHISLENIAEQIKKNRHLFVVLAGNDHEIISSIKNNDLKATEKILNSYIDCVGKENILVELAFALRDQAIEEVKDINIKLSSLCDKHNVRYIISPAPRYLEPEDEEIFRTVLAIRNQKRLNDISLTRDFYIPSLEELQKTYEYLPNITDTSSIEEEINIDIRVDYASKASEAFFPPVDLPKGQTDTNKLKWQSYIGLMHKFDPEKPDYDECVARFPFEKLSELIEHCRQINLDPKVLTSYPKEYFIKYTIQNYFDQIEKELQILEDKGFSRYILVIADLAQFCRKNSIVASARGSGVGSLIGYLNDISTLDTVYYKIPFERFLNPLRPSAPDIDLDVADDQRETVIRYLIEKYGNDRVCQIITFGGMLPRACIRDVGRVLGVSYRKCDQIAKLVPKPPFGKKASFEFAFITSAEFRDLYEKDQEAQRIIDIAKKLEGNYRHASVHAAAVLVTPTPTTDYTPVQWDSEHNMLISQYDWHDAEKVGILPCKIDVLGITNYSILGNSIKIADSRKNINIDLFSLNLNDKKVYDLLTKGRTMGVFQLSSAAMTKYLTELKPTKVEDLMAMVALYRPGPMANIPEFIKRKNNAKYVSYYVPEMQEWMEGTYGILVYQEDIMYTFVNLAGYTFGEADNVRRAMGKKIKSVLDAEYPKFLEGCKKRNIDEEKVKNLWDLIIPFADYSFNKAHSGAYGIAAYWTAYMKANYPAEFMTALMTSEANDLNKIAAAIPECEELGLKVLPPDVNQSFDNFTIEDDTTIRYGFSSVKNLGSDVIKYMIQDRETGGKFSSMEDFLERVSKFQGFNKRSLEALIWSGSLDSLGQKVVSKMKDKIHQQVA